MIDEKLKDYLYNEILPEYNKNENGHGIKHINDVIERSFKLIKNNDLNVDENVVLTVAIFHDIGHHIDAKKHEIISAQIMENCEKLKEFFNEDELKIIKEAIEDHRASLPHEPRSIYGKIISSADRNNTIEQCFERSYLYSLEHEQELNEEEHFERCYDVLNRKFGEGGYAKFYFENDDYKNFLLEIRKLLKDKSKFIAKHKEFVNNKLNK